MDDDGNEDLSVLLDTDTHTYTVEGEVWRSVTQVIRANLGDPYGYVKPHVLEAGRNRGKRLHAMRHYLDEDDLDWSSVAEQDKPWIESYTMWKEATGFKPDKKLNERIVLLRDLRVAGTLDMGGILFGRPSLIDTKSGQCDAKEVGAQTAGYCIGLGEERRDRYGLKLIPGKMAKLIPCKDPRDFAAFRAMCTVHAWRNGAKL